MRCNVTQKFRQLIPDSPFLLLIAFIAEVYRGRVPTVRRGCGKDGEQIRLLH